jgi:uncharacterized protein (TIGR02598 family)
MPAPCHCPQISDPLRRSSSPRATGFSLVELVLAIGVVSFAFVSIFSLIPMGMTAFRQAVDTTVGAQIAHRLINEAQQTDYSTLIATPIAEHYFDDQGNEVPTIADSIYTVDVTVTAPTSLPNTATPDSTNLATVVVKLANNPAHRPTPFDGTSPISYATYTALIARNQ